MKMPKKKVTKKTSKKASKKVSKKTSKKTFVTFVLDETGSMDSIKDDTIGGFNNYISNLKKKPNDFIFTLIKFDSNHQTIVHRAVPISKVPKLTSDTYTPGAMTPLIDACYKAIKATEEKVGKQKVNVAIVIQTDGYENASIQYKNTDLAALVKEKTEAGWLFTFLGAGIDAFGQASQFGIDAGTTLSYGLGNTQQAFAAASRATNSYATTGSSLAAAYTVEEREEASDGTQPLIPPKTNTTDVPSQTNESLVNDLTI